MGHGEAGNVYRKATEHREARTISYTMLLYQEHFCSAMWSMQTGEISLFFFFPFSGFLLVWHCKQALDLFSVGWKRTGEGFN